MRMISVGIIGASGFTGTELLRLCAQHPEFEVEYATGDSQAGVPARSLYPGLAAAYPDLVYEQLDLDRAAELDLIFLGLPHQASMEIAPRLVGRVGCIVDLSAAYRLKSPELYPVYYGFEHTQPDLLDEAVYGLPELHRTALVGARLIATPGCYVTAATIALRPLVEAGIVERRGLIVDAASGVTGAGRQERYDFSFNTVDENFHAYGLIGHRHTPEMEQEIGGEVLFTPHLVPMNRGILATCYARRNGSPATADPATISDESLAALLDDRWSDEGFVAVVDNPQTKACLGSNMVQVAARYDQRTDTVIALAALDNLAKGASGGAVQAANVALGISETAGLTMVGVAP